MISTCIFIFYLTVITCSNLSTPAYGSIEYSHDKISPFDIGTKAIYQCSAGFQISVPDEFDGPGYERLCTGNFSTSLGFWSGYDPICIRMFHKYNIIYSYYY